MNATKTACRGNKYIIRCGNQGQNQIKNSAGDKSFKECGTGATAAGCFKC